MIKTEPNLTKIPKGFRAYKIKGVSETIVARKGGPSAEHIKTKSTYKALRNNQKEFGVASMMSKVLRQSFSENMSAICETYSSGKLTARFRNLAKLEEGQTGTRPMIPSKHGHELNGFEFNNKAPYKKIFGAKYFVKGGSRNGQVILHFPSFIPMEVFDAPAEATNFKINARLVAISDYQYDAKSESYRPIAEGAHGSFGTYESNMLPLLKMPTEPMTGQVSIPVSDLEEGVGTFLIMAVSFFRYESGHFIHLPAHSGMQIHEVY
ncbi:MAG: hypothetical protein ACI8QD_000564 [Cyclobacteriaceae bacterium]|jgi:hypothetical protein